MDISVGTARTARWTGTTLFSRVIGGLGSVASVAAALWYALAVAGVTVDREPSFTGLQPVAERQRIFFHWFVSTLPQERAYTSLAIAAFCCTGLVAAGVADRSGRPVARIGARAVGAGAGLWVVGNVLQLGGHRAVGLMATHGNPLPAVNSINFTIDTVDDAFELAGFAVLGLGLVALGRAVKSDGEADRTWGQFTVLLGLVVLAAATTYVVSGGSLQNVLLVALGAVLLPVWLVWSSSRGTARVLPASPDFGPRERVR